MLSHLLSRLKEPLAKNEAEVAELLPLAAAVLYLEVAWADHDIADEEMDLISRILAAQFDLPPEELHIIVTESRAQHESSVGLYRFTRIINDAWDEEAKYQLVVKLWQLALSDSELHSFEEHTIRKIAELLYVSHSRFIEAKLTAKRGADS
ncbi:MAG: TerB family tellurite resistance protein [Gammaproteobacteria bacterium]|nr:TerB family tellurite resistance protein [Gammaproteobacteria bacterium]